MGMRFRDRFSTHRDSLYPLGAAAGLILVWHLSMTGLSNPQYLLPGPFAVIKEAVNKAPFLSGRVLVTLYDLPKLRSPKRRTFSAGLVQKPFFQNREAHRASPPSAVALLRRTGARGILAKASKHNE